MDRNLALEMVRVTEAAALAAARWMGKGDARSADLAAVTAMHKAFGSINFQGRIKLGEGYRPAVDRLYAEEEIGSGGGDVVELAVDALESTRSVAFGRTNAMAVVAVASQGGIMGLPPTYMEKLAVGADAARAIDLRLSPEQNLARIAEAKGFAVSDLTVAILDRDRHTDLIARVRRTGARIYLIPDGDVSAAIAAGVPGTGIDVLMGIGAARAGVLAAAALRCIDGELLARLRPQSDDEAVELKQSGLGDVEKIYRSSDLAEGDYIMFAATGVTDGDLLNGVRYRRDGATTHSFAVRSRTKTRRFIVTEHYFEENPEY